MDTWLQHVQTVEHAHWQVEMNVKHRASLPGEDPVLTRESNIFGGGGFNHTNVQNT